MDRYYTGYTNNIERRLSEHNRKKKKYTDRGIPWVLVYNEEFDSKIATAREQAIKNMKSRKYIEELIANQ